MIAFGLGFLLTHSCSEIHLTSVVWTCHTFENNFRIKHQFVNYFKESCRLISNEQLSFKYFPTIAFTRDISLK